GRGAPASSRSRWTGGASPSRPKKRCSLAWASWATRTMSAFPAIGPAPSCAAAAWARASPCSVFSPTVLPRCKRGTRSRPARGACDWGVPRRGAPCTSGAASPNVGTRSGALPIDIGLTDEAVRPPDMPLYTLRKRQTGQVRTTTDPGRALLTGKWQDIGKFKGPVLRGLAARAPYFHNGLAADLGAVVDFYDERFAIGFTGQEKADLIAFLEAL